MHLKCIEELTMVDLNDRNRQIIEEFHANGGKVGGSFQNSTVLLLTTTGAKSGLPRVNPLVYMPDGERLVIFASKAGAPTSPDWYYNLVAHPTVTVEVGTEKFNATATVVSGEERDRLYAQLSVIAPGFAEYQQKTTRVIPVVVLERQTNA
jgi:deazaflavin-dependent oxidoreductase (nitroreductase family)